MEAQAKVAVELADQVADYFVRDVIQNALNLPRIQRSEQEKLWPYTRLAHRVGVVVGQLHDGPVHGVEITLCGADFEAPGRDLLVSAALKGVIEGAVGAPVNLVNAPVMAEELGLSISLLTQRDSGAWTRLLGVKLSGARSDSEVQGTLFQGGEVRLVGIDGYHVEAIPEGHLLVSRNDDVPGMIGRVGTLLGEAQINVSRMQISPPREGDRRALAVWNVAQPAPDTLVEAIRALEHIQGCKQITV